MSDSTTDHSRAINQARLDRAAAQARAQQARETNEPVAQCRHGQPAPTCGVTHMPWDEPETCTHCGSDDCRAPDRCQSKRAR